MACFHAPLRLVIGHVHLETTCSIMTSRIPTASAQRTPPRGPPAPYATTAPTPSAPSSQTAYALTIPTRSRRAHRPQTQCVKPTVQWAPTRTRMLDADFAPLVTTARVTRKNFNVPKKPHVLILVYPHQCHARPDIIALEGIWAGFCHRVPKGTTAR